MRLAILGDVHFHLRKYAEFEAKRFSQLIDNLLKSKPDIVVFAGDLLDHARPTLEEIQLLNSQLTILTDNNIVVYIISGNHEAVSLDTCTYDYIKINAIYKQDITIGNPHSIRMLGWGVIKSKQYPESKTKDVLITHLRCNIGLIKEEYNIKELSDNYKLVFMGDIHHRYSPFKNTHYTSSPYSTKFLNKPLTGYGYIELDSETLDWKYMDLDLPCKVKRICKYSDITATLKGLDKHLIKLEVSGTTAELEALPDIPNVIYIKQINLESSESTITTEKHTDALDGLANFIIGIDTMKSYSNSENKIRTKIQEMR